MNRHAHPVRREARGPHEKTVPQPEGATEIVAAVLIVGDDNELVRAQWLCHVWHAYGYDCG